MVSESILALLSDVGDGISNPDAFKCAQPERATVASATGFLIVLITGPSQMQRRIQVLAQLNDLGFVTMDHRREKFDFMVGVSA